MSTVAKSRPLLDPVIVRRALYDSLVKLDPRHQVRNPVMLTVFVGAILTALVVVENLATKSSESVLFVAGISAWLWFTVLFANFGEAMAEGRGKAQADALKATRQNVSAKKLLDDVTNLTVRPDCARGCRKPRYQEQRIGVVRGRHFRLAVVYCAVCKLRRSDGRRAWQGPG